MRVRVRPRAGLDAAAASAGPREPGPTGWPTPWRARALSSAGGTLTRGFFTDQYGVPRQREGVDGTEATASGQPFWLTAALKDVDAGTRNGARSGHRRPETP